MGERTLNFGTDATDADYQIRDSDPAGGDLIIEHLPTGATFEYDATENAWVPTDPIGSTNRRAPGVVADSVDAQSASIDEINADVQLDPTASDWGQAVNDALSTMVKGELLEIPNAVYDTSTTATVTLDGIKIAGQNWSMGVSDQTTPRVIKQADVPVIEVDGGVRADIVGLGIDTNVSDTTAGVVLHGPSYLEGIDVRNLGSHAILCQQDGTNSSTNKTRIKNVSGRYLNDSVVRIENATGDLRNVNAMEVDVRNAVNNTGWAIDADEGMGSQFHVQHISDYQGSANGGIRLNTDRSTAEVTYAEGNITPVIQFDSGSNTGIVGHTGAAEADVFEDNAGGNRKLNRNYNNYVDYEKSGSNPWRFRGGFEADTLATESSGRRVALQHLDSISQTTSTTSQSLSLSGDYASYFVDYFVYTDSATGDVQLVFNGDSSGNGNYTYWDETGTKSTGDYIPLTTTTGGFARITGELTITDAERGSGSEIETGVSHDFGGGRTGRLDGFAQSGSRTVQEQVTSMELTLPSASEFVVDVYGVVER